MKTDLRLILLTVGVIVILAIVLDGLRKRDEKKTRKRFNKALLDNKNETTVPLEDAEVKKEQPLEPDRIVEIKVKSREISPISISNFKFQVSAS